jgi:hypothetical protein
MTAGERWTIGCCLGLAVVLLVFGMPENRSPAARRSVTPARTAVTSVSETTTAQAAATDVPVVALAPEPLTTTTAILVEPVAAAPVATAPTTRPRSTTTTTRRPPTTTTTAPCSLPAIAGQCLALPVP